MPGPEIVERVIDEYMWRQDYLEGLDRDKCLEVGLRLFNEGRVHQSRLSDLFSFPGPSSAQSIWADVVPTTEMDEQVKEAWNHYRFLLNLTKTLPNEEAYK